MITRKNAAIGLTCVLLGLTTSALRAEDSFATKLTQDVHEVIDNGHWDGYLPAYTYHLPFAYDAEHLRRYNNHPWGAGVGKSIVRSDNTQVGLFAMSFQDSHNRPEPIAGYFWDKRWAVTDRGFVSAGYTLFATAREDIGHYVPFPAVLPLAGVGYGSAELLTTYVPGGHNNGNVLFFFGRMRLD